MRGSRTAKLLLLLVLSWYGMMAVHELGHCIGAAVTGAKVEKVVVPLIGFSRTDVAGGTGPLVEVWAGPVVGVLLPLVLLLAVRKARPSVKQTVLFFAGFCLLVNGLYIGLGAAEQVGDCRELLLYGSPMWTLLVFGVLASASGLYALHRLGPVRAWFLGPGNEDGHDE